VSIQNINGIIGAAHGIVLSRELDWFSGRGNGGRFSFYQVGETGFLIKDEKFYQDGIAVG